MDLSGKEGPVDLTPEMLDAYLRILKEHAVGEFIGLGIAVKFNPEIPELSRPAETHPEPKSAWENPRLWPGGKPPTFPK